MYSSAPLGTVRRSPLPEIGFIHLCLLLLAAILHLGFVLPIGNRMSQRKALFISHATPEDSDFTIWLGAKLAAAGYEVWADILRLNGGDDWQRKLEGALRERALKVLLVANERSVAKQGVRNEIQIASDVGQKIQDPNFIVPLRLGPFEAPFLIAHAQYVDFSRGWAGGLHELFELLETEYKIPREGNVSVTPWLSLRSLHGKHLAQRSERLVSNWLRVRRLPEKIFYYGDEELQSRGIKLSSPSVPFGDGFLTCEDHHVESARSCLLSDALDTGWTEIGITFVDMRRRFADLVNQSLELYFASKGLRPYEMANGHNAWWFGHDLSDTRIPFKWQEDKGSRQLRGVSEKRKIHWHFGVSASYRGGPIRHVRIKSRLVFSEAASRALSSKPRMHRLRRSFAKGWRNARWRDMLLAFLWWLSGGESVVSLPMGPDQNLLIEFPPIAYLSPVGILEDSVIEDSDDPDVEFIDDEEIDDEE
jgi:hypothetical protein